MQKIESLGFALQSEPEAELAGMASIRERDGIVDQHPENFGGAVTTSNNAADCGPYLKAKTRFLQSRRIYEAARTRSATEVIERDDSDLVKIL